MEEKVKKVKTSIVLNSDPMAISPEAMKQRMELEQQKRKILTDYISANMVEGQDYGTISFQTRSGQTVESKPTLFKPGSEKFCSLFGLRATFRSDIEVIGMLGNKPGIVAFICELVTKDGKVVGEGRGVAEITEKAGWTLNNAVKIAEKRAQIDAVLRSGGLSDFFTQDLDDTAEKDPKTGQMVVTDPKISQPQMALVFKIMSEQGIKKEEMESYLLKTYNAIGVENLPRRAASELIDRLIKKYPKQGGNGQISPKNEGVGESVPVIDLDEANEGDNNPF